MNLLEDWFMDVHLQDYWRNGNIDLMVNEIAVCEIEKSEGSYELSFNFKVQLENLNVVEQWVKEHSVMIKDIATIMADEDLLSMKKEIVG